MRVVFLRHEAAFRVRHLAEVVLDVLLELAGGAWHGVIFALECGVPDTGGCLLG